MPTHTRAATQAVASAREVTIVVDTSTAFSRCMLRGVSQWMGRHPGWLVTVVDRGRGGSTPELLGGWNGNGLISGVPEHDLPRTGRGSRRPVVMVRDRLTDARLPGVYPDDEAAVRMAVAHLVERGLRHVGVCAIAHDTTLQRDATIRFAQAADCTVDVFAALAPARPGMPAKPERDDASVALGRWLTSLPKPVGIIAGDDVQVLDILAACRDLGLDVPEDVAVVAVTDDDTICGLAHPAVSAVTHDPTRLGLEAARVLDEAMMTGEPPAAVVLVPPTGIAVRQSSDLLAVDDHDIRRAMSLIKERACCDLSASQVATAIGVSRKLLDRKFQLILGRTIHDELQRTRLTEAKRLLAETDHKLLVVSVRAGFTHAAQLCNVFKSAVGMSPMQYRKSARACRKLPAMAATSHDR